MHLLFKRRGLNPNVLIKHAFKCFSESCSHGRNFPEELNIWRLSFKRQPPFITSHFAEHNDRALADASLRRTRVWELWRQPVPVSPPHWGTWNGLSGEPISPGEVRKDMGSEFPQSCPWLCNQCAMQKRNQWGGAAALLLCRRGRLDKAVLFY